MEDQKVAEKNMAVETTIFDGNGSTSPTSTYTDDFSIDNSFVKEIISSLEKMERNDFEVPAMVEVPAVVEVPAGVEVPDRERDVGAIDDKIETVEEDSEQDDVLLTSRYGRPDVKALPRVVSKAPRRATKRKMVDSMDVNGDSEEDILVTSYRNLAKK